MRSLAARAIEEAAAEQLRRLRAEEAMAEVLHALTFDESTARAQAIILRHFNRYPLDDAGCMEAHWR